MNLRKNELKTSVCCVIIISPRHKGNRGPGLHSGLQLWVPGNTAPVYKSGRGPFCGEETGWAQRGCLGNSGWLQAGSSCRSLEQGLAVSCTWGTFGAQLREGSRHGVLEMQCCPLKVP